MAKQENDIRSTEKLLEIIRDKDSTSAPQSQAISTTDTARPKSRSLVSFKKKVSVGVDIGHNNIRLAKIIRSDKANQLIDYLDVPFNKSISIKNPAFKAQLKTA